MKYIVLLIAFCFTWTFFTTPACATISSRPSFSTDPKEKKGPSLELINGTSNYRMHGKKSKDDKWSWDGREGRYIYCVREAQSKCEDLIETECFGQNFTYSTTSLDLTRYYSQYQALDKLLGYRALRHVPKCWNVIQPFLCAVFLPKCENINGVDYVYLPSVEMCRITTEPCRILYNSSFFPDFLKCNETNFPSKCNNDVREMKFNLAGECLSPLVPTVDPANSYEDIDDCGLECNQSPYYTAEEHRQIRRIVKWGASICLSLNLFALLTFVIDWHNGNKYPALVIFYVNLCFMIACIGFLSQFIPGARQNIVCRSDNTLKQGEPNGGENLSCIVVFILVYYFLTAAMCWFVIFTYAWHIRFRAIGKIQERADKKASYFHLIAWSIPLVLTISILAISEVDGNSIVGICFVGYVNHPIRGGFVIGPLLCSLLIGGYFLVRGMIILINLKISSKQVISPRASKKIRQSIIRMGICSLLILMFIVTTIVCHIYEFKNSINWAVSLKNFIICKITSADSYEGSSTSCRISERPSISMLQLHLLSLFASGIVMASFVFTPSTVEIWGRYIRRKFSGDKSDEPLKLQKHKVIAQAFAKRKVFQNQGRLSISFHNSHTDPVGLKFDMNSAPGSHDFSSTWANNLPRFVNRRYALTGCASSSSHGHRRNSIDSEISFSVRHVSVESRRNSNDSQVSVKIAEMKTKVASRSRGSKSKTRSSRHHRKDFTSKRYSRKESSTSMESQIVAMSHKNSRHSASTADVGHGMLVPMGPKRRSGIPTLDPEQINELIAKNKFLLPFLPMSDDDKSSVGSFNIQDSKLDVILKQIGMSEHKIIENKLTDHIADDDSDSDELQTKKSNDFADIISSKENGAVAGRISKNSNRSGGSKKSIKTGVSSRLRKSRKSTRSVTKTTNPLAITSSSGRIKDKKSDKDKKSKEKQFFHNSQDESFNSIGIEMSPLNNGNIHSSYSGRSDVGVQANCHEIVISSGEFAEKLMMHGRNDEDDDDDEPMEDHKFLSKRISIGANGMRRGTNEISLTESEKLKLLLLPSN